jgi:hypothetical protein
MALAAITWVGQGFGGILTGQGTDPNSGPLLFLLALAYWPIRPQATPATAAHRRPSLLRIGIAVAAAALVGASSLAAAMGVTTATPATKGSTRLSATFPRMFGPGPLVSHSRLAGYRISFRDAPNRSARPGVLSLGLRRNGQAVDGAKVSLTFRSLDLNMNPHTNPLLPRGQGHYISKGPLLGMGGRWRITVSVLPRQGRALLLSLTDLIAA